MRITDSLADKENAQSFTHGSIQKIIMKNFLTYDNVVCKPGPFLNVVIGPNGTGKSSIICGICLAVGGNPKLLGRSDIISDFVKHGKEQGSVALHIWDSERKRVVVFTVLLCAKKNSASFLIDGKHKKVSEVREESKGYNIQVDNPCTFLAQDKVKSFAEQGPQKLLRNTEKAGPTNLSQLHDEIEEISGEGSDYQGKIDRQMKRLENIQMELKTKKDRMENYLEWEARNKTLKSLRIKKEFLEYQHRLEDLKAALTNLDDTKKRLDTANNQKEQKDKSVKGIEKTLDEIERKLTQLKRSRQTEFTRMKELASQVAMDEKLQNVADKYQRVENAYQNWDKEKGDINKDHEHFKQLYEMRKLAFTPDPELQRMEQQMIAENKRINEEGQSIATRQSALFRLGNQLNTKVTNQNNLMENKIQGIVSLRKNPDIMSAWNYYTKNRELFTGPVFVPFLHVHIPNINNAVYFSSIIGARDLGIFIFSCREDEDLLLNRFKIDSSIVTEPMIQAVQTVKTEISAEMKELGFIDYLFNLIVAPGPVLAYLNAFFNLDKILIGGNSVDENYERICKQANEINSDHHIFLTNKIRVSVYYSRFDPTKEYIERNFISHAANKFGNDHTRQFDDIDSEIRQLEADKRELTQRQIRLQDDRETNRKRREEFVERKKKEKHSEDQLEALRQQLRKYDDRLKECSKEKPDIAAAKEAYMESKRKIIGEALQKLDEFTTFMEEQREHFVTYALSCDEQIRLSERKNTLGREKSILKEQCIIYQTSYQQAMKAREKIKENVEDAKLHFKKVTSFSPAENEMSREEAKDFANIKEEWAKNNVPDDLEELEVTIRKEQSKASKGRQEGTIKDLEEYEKLTKEIVDVTTDIDRTKRHNEIWKRKMDEKLDAWLNGLRQLVTQISDNFSQFFAQLGCAGEVRLEEPENRYKIEEYGIKILIKFRNGTSLRELNPQTQSGGERSVATMLYIMALQNLCSVPFRCVDEINQGMDPVNERAVFNMMVGLLNTGDKISKTQYFLLTPKLLSGLAFNEKVTVLIVHNGPYIDNAEHWDAERFLNE